MKPKAGFFKKINRIEKALVRFIKRKKEREKRRKLPMN